MLGMLIPIVRMRWFNSFSIHRVRRSFKINFFFLVTRTGIIGDISWLSITTKSDINTALRLCFKRCSS